MQEKTYNVLFLCTGNPARSILAEVLINHLGRGRFRGHSAGSRPRGSVHPMTFELLGSMRFPTTGLRPKSMDEFSGPDAPLMDFVFTVCDQAAESCPVWPGDPVTAHWGVPDPAAAEGTENERRAFRQAMLVLEARIKLFTAMPFEKLDRLAIKREVDAIGRKTTDEA